MKFDVKFTPSRKFDVVGPGALYIDETGIVVEGDFPRFYVPFLGRVLRQIICARSQRTIPFSRIKDYKVPNLLRSTHHLAYVLPDRSTVTVRFKMRWRRQTNAAEFTARFYEYKAAAQTLQT